MRQQAFRCWCHVVAGFNRNSLGVHAADPGGEPVDGNAENFHTHMEIVADLSDSGPASEAATILVSNADTETMDSDPSRPTASHLFGDFGGLTLDDNFAMCSRTVAVDWFSTTVRHCCFVYRLQSNCSKY